MIVLDSDVLIEMLDRKSVGGSEAFKHIVDSGEDICTTVISLHEVLFGFHKYRKPVNDLCSYQSLIIIETMQSFQARLNWKRKKPANPLVEPIYGRGNCHKQQLLSYSLST